MALLTKRSKPKVKRYFPGQAPDFAPVIDPDDQPKSTAGVRASATTASLTESSPAPVVINLKKRRLLGIETVALAQSPPDEVRTGVEPKVEPPPIVDEETIILSADLAKVGPYVAESTESDESDESDGSDPTESSDEETTLPIFIPASNRVTKSEVITSSSISKEILIDAIERVEAAEKEQELQKQQLNSYEPSNMPDDSDDVNDEEQYEAWRTRELKRLKELAEERVQWDKFNRELQTRREMDEAEKRLDDQRIDSTKQKYYHKGAYFQDLAQSGAEPAYLRDFNAPVEDEKYDRSLLPKPMQVRRGQFGQKGRTKHTHLSAVDTTDFTSPWAKARRQRQPK